MVFYYEDIFNHIQHIKFKKNIDNYIKNKNITEKKIKFRKATFNIYELSGLTKFKDAVRRYYSISDLLVIKKSLDNSAFYTYVGENKIQYSCK
jgi:hypothetical protein